MLPSPRSAAGSLSSLSLIHIYVQYNDRTDKKLEGFFPHAQHLLPPTDRGEEEDLTACSDCSLRVQQRFNELSITGRAKNVNFRRLTVPESVV